MMVVGLILMIVAIIIMFLASTIADITEDGKPVMCKIFGHKFFKAEYIWIKCFRCGYDSRRDCN